MTESAMTEPVLTFCIPTHDGRGPFLREALESILGQAEDVPSGCITVSISDNASQDETRAIVAGFQVRFPGLVRYARHDTNQGFTSNMLRAVGEAEGDYGWLFSSDDRVVPGGVKRVWEALRGHPGLAGMTVDFQSYDSTLTRPLPPMNRLLYPSHWDETHLYHSLPEAFRECASMMGYISGQIMHLPLWRETLAAVGEAAVRQAGYFPYVYLNGEMLKRQPCWLWLPEPVVQNRLGNDSVTRDLNQNIVRYQTTVLRDTAWVWGQVLGQGSAVYRQLVRANFESVWGWRALCSYKVASRCSLAEEARALGAWTRVLYFLPRFWLSDFPVLLIPRQILRLAVLPVARRLNLALPEGA